MGCIATTQPAAPMASFETLQKLAEHPDWIDPRSDLRVFLGEPGAPEATKTTIEPGNVFSPGMMTFGVTYWLRLPATDDFFATETMPLDALRWSYEEGYLPLIHCRWDAGGVGVWHSLFQDGTAAERSEAVRGRVRLTNTRDTAMSVQLFIALRSLGPAGGPVHDLRLSPDGRGLWLARRDLPLLTVDEQATAAGCGVGDPSPLALLGQVPEARSAEDAEGWCYGLFRWDLDLSSGSTWQVHFDCPMQTYDAGPLTAELPSTATSQPDAYDQRAAAHLDQWRERLGRTALEVPDQAFHDAFYAGLQHMLTAVVGDQIRIAPLSYPLPWLRDSVFIQHCFDLAGLHHIARAGAEYCARNDFFGGFGAEGDAPGQGIWALVEHYRVTRDRDWLRGVYPAILRKCDWLFRMRRAEAPIQVVSDTPVLSFTHSHRASGVICLAARDGIIRGTMDHGVEHALGWVNHWALRGLRDAAYAATVLGEAEDAARYTHEADELNAALERYADAHPDFFGHERTVNSLLWPTRAWEDRTERIAAGFDRWWQEFRGDAETYRPEPYWLYFEFAQAHNALLLGQPERAWQVLRYRLEHQDLPGLYGYREGGAGVGTRNAVHGVTLIGQLRGCHKLFHSITPHGWSASELWLLQRAMLVEEWRDGLLLFAGVPREWLRPNGRIAFRAFPTAFGTVDGTLEIDAAGRSATATLSGVEPGTDVTVRLAGHEATATARNLLGVTMNLELRFP